MFDNFWPSIDRSWCHHFAFHERDIDTSHIPQFVVHFRVLFFKGPFAKAVHFYLMINVQINNFPLCYNVPEHEPNM